MIISHKHRFIFIKTRKTAGTSLEVALCKYLGKDDIITPISLEDENIRRAMGFLTKQNYKKSISELRLDDLVYVARRMRNRMIRKHGASPGVWPSRFYNHMPCYLVRDQIGLAMWNGYYKFSIERNPWDAAVSRYFWHYGNKKISHTKDSFRKFIQSEIRRHVPNYDLYSIDGVPAMDLVVRYEALSSGLEKVSRVIGLSENIHEVMKGISAKAQFRRNVNYREMYDEESKELVAERCAREISLFDYVF